MQHFYFPVVYCVLTAVLAVILLYLSVIDLRTFTLPDRLTLPLIALGLCLAVILPDPSLASRSIGAAAGFFSLGLIGEVHFRRSGVEGLGLGDAKLFAAAGAWLGWQALPMVMLIAAVSGIIYVLILRKEPHTAPIAFGPMLSLAFFLCWLALLHRSCTGFTS